jgi:5-deoxy-5-amino-3-dehydroquinate synthase
MSCDLGDFDDIRPEDVGMTPEELHAALETFCTHVQLGDRSYAVWVGRGVSTRLDAELPETAKRIAVVTQDGIPDLVTTERSVVRCTIGHGEGHKTLATVESLCRSFARAGVTRNDCVVAVGGGMVTDVAGFAAATYHRGIPVVHLPTTLLGMVDAAIGGKTGVNLPEGKNLVGAFWQPTAVICDLVALDTLPERELRCGYGEMAKYHFLYDGDLLARPLVERVGVCAMIKGAVVARDEREAPGSADGLGRAILNYGHTLAHALEITTDHALRHGEAVAIGLVYAAELAAELGRIDAARVADHRRVVADYGLDDALPPGQDPDRLIELMARDKKALDGFTFVLDGPDGLELVSGVSEAAMRAALERTTRGTG